MITTKEVLHVWRKIVLKNNTPSRNKRQFGNMMREHFPTIELTDTRFARYDAAWSEVIKND